MEKALRSERALSYDRVQDEALVRPSVDPTLPSVATHTHTLLGNAAVDSVLGAEAGTGFGDVLGGALALAAAGIVPDAAFGLGSNQAMLAAMRDAQAPDYDAAHPSLRTLRPGGGRPLPAAVAQRMSAVLGHPFDHVRIHTDAKAAEQAQALNAHAFAIGPEIWFGDGEFAPGTQSGDKLLLHELTHVVQHDEGRLPQASGQGLSVSSPDDLHEREAEANASDLLPQVQSFGSLDSSGPGQESSMGLALEAAPVDMDAGGEVGAEAAGPEGDGVLSRGIIDAVAGGAEWLVRQVSPELADLISKGPGELIKKALEPAIADWVGSLTGGIDLGSIATSLTSGFSDAFATIQGVLSGDAGCCKAFAAAIDGIRSLAKSFVDNPVFNTLKDAFGKVTSMIGEVTKLILAPAFDALKGIVGGAWDAIKGVAETVSGWMQKVRDFASSAWDWVAEKLGLSGGGGIIDWLKKKADEIWTSIKETLAPLVAPIKKLAMILAVVTPMGQVYLLVKYAPKVFEAVSWLWQHRDDPDIVKSAHAEMGGTILPQLLEAGASFRDMFGSAVSWLTEQLTALGSALLETLGAISGVPLLSMFQGFIQRAQTAVQSMTQWATGAFKTASDAIKGVWDKVVAFVTPWKEVLCSIAYAIVNPAGIPLILAGWAWRALPQCVKIPIIDLLLDAAIGFLEAIPYLPMMGLLWPIVKQPVLGFLYQMKGKDADTKEKVADKIAKIVSGASPDFLIGFVKGFLKGAWDDLVFPFELIWHVAEGVVKVVDWMGGLAEQALTGGDPQQTQTTEGEQPQTQGADPNQSALAQRAGEMAADIRPDVDAAATGFMPAVQEVFSGGGGGMTLDDLVAKLGDVWSTIQTALQGAGASLADKVCEFFTSDGAESSIGEGLGYVAGIIAVEAILSVLTVGAWEAASPALRALEPLFKVINWGREALNEIFGLIFKLGGFILEGAKGLGRLFGKMGGAASEVVGAIERIGSKLVAYGEELLVKFGTKMEEGLQGLGKTLLGPQGERMLTVAAEKRALQTAEGKVLQTGERTLTEGETVATQTEKGVANGEKTLGTTERGATTSEGGSVIGGETTQSTRTLSSTQPKDVVDMNVSAFKTDVQAQQTLYDASKGAVSRMKSAGDDIVQGMEKAEVSSLMKRENFDEFVSEVVKKQTNEGYKRLGDMPDIVRGRFNLQSEADVQMVVERLKARFGDDVVKIKPPREGYPRWHVNVRDAETGLVHEWQVGTDATTKFFETRSLEIPGSITKFKGQPDFHDGVYKLLNKVDDPAVRVEFGIDDLMNEYKAFAEETGRVTNGAPLPQNYAERYNAMSDRISETLRQIESKQPGYMDRVLSGETKVANTTANVTTNEVSQTTKTEVTAGNNTTKTAGGETTTTTSTLQSTQPRDVVNMNVSEWKGNVEAQHTLFDASKGAVSRMKAAGDEIVSGMEKAEVSSLMKRENFDEFVSEVVKKQTNEGYKKLGDMPDIVRGRFNLQSEQDVQLVVERLQQRFGDDVVKIKPPREGYPRWHVNVRDAETGLVHEWQVGTDATTKFFETKSLEIPGSITKFKGQPDFHDGVYKLLNKVDDPAVRAEFGIDDLMNEYKVFAEETGKVTNGAPFPQNYTERYKAMSDRISETLRQIESKQPGYMDRVLSGETKVAATTTTATTTTTVAETTTPVERLRGTFAKSQDPQIRALSEMEAGRFEQFQTSAQKVMDLPGGEQRLSNLLKKVQSPEELGTLLQTTEVGKLERMLDAMGQGPHSLKSIQESLEQLKVTESKLGEARDHLTEPQFLDRAGMSSTGETVLSNSKRIPTNQSAVIEPIPGTNGATIEIKSISVLEADGKVLGKLKKGNLNVPTDPPVTLQIETQNGTIVWNTAESPPAGLRFQLRPGQIKERGFSGGHTEDAWKQTLDTYGDQVKVLSQDPIAFQLPGGERIDVTAIRYEFKGTEAKLPKTIFNGSGTGPLTQFEEHMGPYVQQALQSAAADARIIEVTVPVKGINGQPVSLQVHVAREPADGTISSWWISETNLTNPALKPGP